MYERAIIRFWPENECCLTQKVDIKNILKLNPNSNGALFCPFNPILFQQPLDKYEKAITQFRPEIKSCLTQWANLEHILISNPNSHGPVLVPSNPILLQQPLNKYEDASINFWPQNKICLTNWETSKTFWNLAFSPNSNEAHLSPF